MRRLGVDARQPESALRESLVVDDEAPAVPEENLDAVTPLPKEDEVVAAVGIAREHTRDESGETVVPPSQVDRLSSDEDLRAWPPTQHDAAMARTSAAMYAGSVPLSKAR